MVEANTKKQKAGPLTFFSQVRQEGRKVTWTSRQEVIMATILVLIMVTIAAGFFYITDMVVSLLVQFITGVQSIDG